MSELRKASMVRVTLVLLASLLSVAAWGQEIPDPPAIGAIPSDRQLAWHKLEYYGFLHYGLNTYTTQQWGLGSEKPSLFNPTSLEAEDWAEVAENAGMKALILVVKHHSGFALWPSEHTEYSVENSPWKSGAGDVLADLAVACRARGLKLGVYYSPWDRNSPDYGTSDAEGDCDSPDDDCPDDYVVYLRNQLKEILDQDRYGEIFEVWFDGANGGSGYYKGYDPARTDYNPAPSPYLQGNGSAYNRYIERRSIDRQAYYEWSVTYDLVSELQPGALIFSDGGPHIRWVGNEWGESRLKNWSALSRVVAVTDARGNPLDENGVRTSISGNPPAMGELYPGFPGYRYAYAGGQEDGTHWMPVEADISIRTGWFHDPGQSPKSLELLHQIYYATVGRNSALLMNFPVDRNGDISAADTKRANELKAWLDQDFETDLALDGTASATDVREPGSDSKFKAGNVNDGDNNTYWATNNEVRGAKVTIEFTGPTEFNTLLVQEYIKLGQRVKKFSIEYETDAGEWERVPVYYYDVPNRKVTDSVGTRKVYATAVGGDEQTTIGYKRIVQFDTVRSSKVRLNVLDSRASPLLSNVEVYRTREYDPSLVTGESPPRVTVAAFSERVLEGERALFRVSADRGLTAPLPVTVGVTQTGSVVAGEAPATVMLGEGTRAATLVVRTDDDGVVEEDGAVTATLAAGDGYALGTATSATVAVVDNDAADYGMSAAPSALEEGGSAAVRVWIDNGVTHAGDLPVELLVEGDVEASDYALEVSTQTLPAGSDAFTATLTALEDGVGEETETLRLSARIDGATHASVELTIADAREALTARFDAVPGHEGAGTTATLRLAFSEPVSTSYATLRDESFAAAGGAVRGARRVDGRSDRWDIEVAADSAADVVVTLPATTDCAARGAVCTADRRPLSHALTATVAGPLEAVVGVTGVPQVGQRLAVALDGKPETDTTYAWLRDGAEIAGATGAGHVLTGSDAGARLSVRVSSGGRIATSAATIPVWGLPGNPPLAADEEELLGTVLTVGSTDAYTLRLGGYGRLSKAEFGALESTALGAGELSAAFVNDIGDVTLVVSPAPAAPAELTMVWDGYRIGPLAAGTSSEGPYVTGRTPQPRAAYLRYLDGSSDGVRVALSVRRTVRPPAATVTAVGESVSEGEPALFEVTLERAPEAPLAVTLSVSAAGGVLDGAAPEWWVTGVRFAAGESTARLTVATHDDRVVEGDGSVTATLAEGDGYEPGEPATATVTVEDDDTATFALTAAPAVLAEGATSTVTVAIEDGATFADAKTIVLAVTGPAASDYALEPETLELAAGASAATAAFAALADELDETPAAARIAALVDGAEVASATLTIRDASADARLAALALSEADIGAFEAETTVYAATVAADVAVTTVTAQPADAHAAVEIADAAGSTLGTERTSRLAGGTNEIAATVTAEDRATTRTYTVTVTRDEAPAWGTHRPERDIALGGDGESTGLWSDGETLWALADWDGGAAQAYELATGARLRSRDLRLDDGFSQTALFSDGITLWAPSFYGGARAYALADGARLAERDLDESLSAAGNERPSGLWSDGSTWYVSNLDDARLYAYAADGTRREGREFGFRTGDVQGGWPWGLWSDGETLLTSWHGRGRVLAYRLADGARLPARDIDTGAVGNDDPRDVWSDGETLWVADGADRKLYAYAAPGLVRPAASGLLPVRVASRAHAVPSADPGAPVSIPDAGLRGRLAAALGKAPDAPLGAHELLALESLDARGAGIADLTGLEHAANLVAVDLGRNPLTDLRPLAGLANLEALNLDATGADPWAVAALGGLQRLSLRDNGIGDVSALAGLAKLRALDLAGNVIEDASPLAGLSSLAALDLRDNRIEDLSPLARSRATVDGRGNPAAPSDGPPAAGRAR